MLWVEKVCLRYFFLDLIHLNQWNCWILHAYMNIFPSATSIVMMMDAVVIIVVPDSVWVVAGMCTAETSIAASHGCSIGAPPAICWGNSKSVKFNSQRCSSGQTKNDRIQSNEYKHFNICSLNLFSRKFGSIFIIF